MAFGGIGFVPNRLANGQVNRGRGSIGITPFAGPQCTGAALVFMPATPAFDDSTPRDVEFAMTFNGAIPPATVSIRFEIRMATTSANSFQLCFRTPWMTLIEGAPDLDPDIEVYAGDYGLRESGVPGEQFVVSCITGLRTATGCPRGKLAVFIVYVVNRGAWVATAGRRSCTYPAVGNTSSGSQTARTSPVRPADPSREPLPVGETVRLCAAFHPAGASSAEVTAITAVAGDSNPSNDQASSTVIEAEPPRIAQPLAPPILPLGSGRRR